MGSERSKSALNCHGQPNHFPPMISNSSNIWTVRERSGADNGWAACCITTIALRPEPQAPKGAFHVCSHGGLGISTYQSLDRGDEIDGCRSSEQRIRFGGLKVEGVANTIRRPAIEFLHGTGSQFDVSSIVDIKLLEPCRKDLPKPLNRLGIPEKQFYRAADVAQLLGYSVALVLWRFRTGKYTLPRRTDSCGRRIFTPATGTEITKYYCVSCAFLWLIIFSLAFRSGGPGKVILSRARVEFFNLLNFVRHLPAQRPLLCFSHPSCGFQFDQSFVDGAQRNVYHTRGLAHGDSGCLHGGCSCREIRVTDDSHERLLDHVGRLYVVLRSW